MASNHEQSGVSCMISSEELLAGQRKEKKVLTAKTQNMKHSVPKGDIKKKKEVAAEIALLFADLELKHKAELDKFALLLPNTKMNEKSESFEEVHEECNSYDLPESVPNHLEHVTESSMTNVCTNVKSTQRVSKAQKRRNKKAALERERNNAIAAQELENLNGLRHLEFQQIQKKLAEKNLSIFEIPPDGNCLYSAIEHQLSVLNLPLMTVKTLREETSKYLLSHKEDYIPFLTSPDTGECFSDDMYVKYCNDVANTNVWAGHVEIQVLSHIIALPIEVIQADGPNIVTGIEDEKCSRKLTLCYHRHVFGLGEHYNSVIPMTE